MTYFYARVSSKEQVLDRQLEAAKAWGNIDKVIEEKASGKDFDKRPKYQKMKQVIQPGDELVVKELDRFGRNKEQMKDELRWFHDHGVTVRILDLPSTLIDFQGQQWIGDMVTNIMVEVLGAVAEQERKKMLKRQKEAYAALPVVNGRKISVRTGEPMGRKPKEHSDFQKFREKQKGGIMSVKECCEAMGISRSMWYYLVKQES